MTVSSPPPPPETSTQPAKKGLSPLAWVGIGCLVLLLVGAAAFFSCTIFLAKKATDFAEEFEEDPWRTMAETAVKLNPDLELVDLDEDEGTMTILEKSTGKQVTVDFRSIAEGRLTFESDEGEVTFDAQGGEEGVVTVRTGDEEVARYGAGLDQQLPDWIPTYPGTDPAIVFTGRTGESTSGSFTFSSADSPADVLAFYRERLEEAGWEVHTTSMPTGGLVNAETGGRTLTLIIGQEQGATQAQGSYSAQQ